MIQQVRTVTLHPIRPGSEEHCPSWAGFPLGTLVRQVGAAPDAATTKVVTMDGEVIVAYLPYMMAVGRGQIEAQRRNTCVRVLNADADANEFEIMHPDGMFRRCEAPGDVEPIAQHTG